MALRRPDAGWHSPLAVVVRDASVTVPHLLGSQDSVKRCALEALMVASGAGATITDCGAIAQTGTVRPLADPHSSCTGSLYQRCVKGPDARASARVTRVSHLTLFVP